MSEESYSEFIFKGTSITFILTVVTGGFSLGMRMLISKGLSPTDYGIFFSVFTVIGMLRLFRNLGLGSAINRFLPEFREKEDFTSLKSSVVITLVIQFSAAILVCGLLFIFSEEIATGFIGSRSAVPIIQVLSIWYVIMTFVRGGAKILQAFKDIAGNQSVEAIRILSIFLALALLSYFSEIELLDTAFIFVSSAIITSLWILFRLKQNTSIFSIGEIEFSRPLANKLVRFGLPLIFAGLAGTITGYIDTLVITALRTAEEVGFYQIARPATRLISMMGMAVGVPLLPMVSEQWAKNEMGKIKSTMYFLIKFSLLFTIPFVLVFLSFPEVIIRILFSPKYLPAAMSVRILSITMLMANLFGLLGKVLIGVGKSALYSKIYGLAAILNLVGDIVLVYYIGIEGAAIAFLFSHLIAFIIGYFYLRRSIRFDVPASDLGKIVLGSLIALLLILSIKNVLSIYLWVEIVFILVCSGLFYLAWILNTNVLRKKDLILIKRTFPVPDWVINILRKLVR